MNVVFFGTPEFAVPALEEIARSRHTLSLIVAQPDRPAGRGMKLRRPAVAERAEEMRLPLMQPERIRNEEFLESVRQMRPDVGVIIAYGKILPASLLEIPAHGFINVHGSLLPKYRGAAPIQRAIADGLSETGVTIMQVDEELDHGPIVSMRSTPIGSDERSPELFERLSRLGAEMIVETLDAIERGDVDPREQKHDEATIAPRIDKEEGRVSLSDSASSIYDRFRAFWPWPGLSIDAAGERLKLIEIRPEKSERSAEPGTILQMDAESAVVATGEGALRLVEVQRPGKKRVAAADYVRGRRLEPGRSLL